MIEKVDEGPRMWYTFSSINVLHQKERVMVQFVNVRELKNRVSEVIRRTRKGDVVVTLRGKPTVVLHAVVGDELEDYLLAHSPKFLKSLKKSYQEYRRKGGVSIETLLARTERELARLQR